MDKFDRYYVHLDMETVNEGKQLWIDHKSRKLDKSKLGDGSRYNFGEEYPVYLNLGMDDGKFFINDYFDEKTFALCRTSVL